MNPPGTSDFCHTDVLHWRGTSKTKKTNIPKTANNKNLLSKTNFHETDVFAAGSERSSVAPAQPERPPPPLPPPRFPNSGVWQWETAPLNIGKIVILYETLSSLVATNARHFQNHILTFIMKIYARHILNPTRRRNHSIPGGIILVGTLSPELIRLIWEIKINCRTIPMGNTRVHKSDWLSSKCVPKFLLREKFPSRWKTACIGNLNAKNYHRNRK